MADLTNINHGDAQKYFQRELDEHGSLGQDQIKLSHLEDLDETDDEGYTIETWAVDIYDHEMYDCETALYCDEEEAREDYEALLKLCRPTKLHKIPCSWQMYGYMEVRAESIEEAVMRIEDSTPLPVGNYIEGSFEINHPMIEEMKEEAGEV